MKFLSLWIGALCLSLSTGAIAQIRADPLNRILGYEPAVRPLVSDEVIRHIPSEGNGIHTWLHAGPRFLSWAILLGGAALIATGATADDDRYQKGAIITGSILAPLGLWGVLSWDEPQVILVEDSTVRDYETVLQSVYKSTPEDRQRVEALIAQHPELHKRLLFSMRALRNPRTETLDDTAFIDWYQGFSE